MNVEAELDALMTGGDSESKFQVGFRDAQGMIPNELVAPGPATIASSTNTTLLSEHGDHREVRLG